MIDPALTKLKKLLGNVSTFPTGKQQEVLKVFSDYIEKETDNVVKGWLINVKAELELRINGGAK